MNIKTTADPRMCCKCQSKSVTGLMFFKDGQYYCPKCNPRQLDVLQPNFVNNPERKVAMREWMSKVLQFSNVSGRDAVVLQTLLLSGMEMMQQDGFGAVLHIIRKFQSATQDSAISEDIKLAIAMLEESITTYISTCQQEGEGYEPGAIVFSPE